MSDVVLFEIHASDPARALVFHEAVFGWKFRRNQPVTGTGAANA